jgi:hypothetical protein
MTTCAPASKTDWVGDISNWPGSDYLASTYVIRIMYIMEPKEIAGATQRPIA